MSNEEVPAVIKTDTTPSKPGFLTSTFWMSALGMAFMALYPMIEAAAVSWVGKQTENSWAAILGGALIALFYGINRRMNTSNERNVKAAIAQSVAQAATANSFDLSSVTDTLREYAAKAAGEKVEELISPIKAAAVIQAEPARIGISNPVPGVPVEYQVVDFIDEENNIEAKPEEEDVQHDLVSKVENLKGDAKSRLISAVLNEVLR